MRGQDHKKRSEICRGLSLTALRASLTLHPLPAAVTLLAEAPDPRPSVLFARAARQRAAGARTVPGALARTEPGTLR